MSCSRFRFLRLRSRLQSGQRSKSYLNNNSKTTVQPATCYYQSRRAASPHYKFAPRLRHFSVGKSRGRRGFSVERSGAKRARRGAARLMSLAHDVIGSGAREAALIGVKKINAYRTQKLQTAMSLHNLTTGTDCMCICVQV